MPNVPRDQAAAISTNYQAIYLKGYREGVEALGAKYKPLIMPFTLTNFQGNQLSLDWLGAIPSAREWKDERKPFTLKNYEWNIKSKRWEATIEIDLDLHMDARFDIYGERIRNLAFVAPRHDFEMISDKIKFGDSEFCYDGQYFFDDDHAEGESGSQSNLLSGAGADTFAHFIADYYKAKAALMQFKDDRGKPTWVGDFRPLIWAPAGAGIMQIIETARNGNLQGGGDTNIIANQFDAVYDPNLTDVNDWYMFNPAQPVKPFASLSREAFHYEDNFGTGNETVWDSRIGEASSVGRDNIEYAEWRNGVKIVN